jgi:uncharacterized repeat protein (TIGR03943 family)
MTYERRPFHGDTQTYFSSLAEKVRAFVNHPHRDMISLSLERGFTIAACGALSAVMFLEWAHGGVGYFLVPKYHPAVLTGCVLLAAMVLIRAVAVGFSLTGAEVHDHPLHNHELAPWRYVVMVLPLVLFFLIPAEAFSANGTEVDPNSVGEFAHVPVRAGGVQELGVTQLERASTSLEGRNHFEGRLVKLTGQFVGEDEKRFTLTRFRMNCCAADALPLRAVVMVDEKSKESVPRRKLKNKWVEVTGRVQFLSLKNGNGFLPALVVSPTEHEPLDKLIVEVPQPANPYVN